jgi:hypothetical protein
MYEGHMPNGSPVQKHSVGELYPVVIVAYGDGTWQWVDPSRRAAGVVRWSKQAHCVAAARMYINTVVIATPSQQCRDAYKEFINDHR